jgi:hypothetical protein
VYTYALLTVTLTTLETIESLSEKMGVLPTRVGLGPARRHGRQKCDLAYELRKGKLLGGRLCSSGTIGRVL